MSRYLPLGFVPLALVLAWFVRVQQGLPPGALDEGAAAHLRRIELCLIEDGAPIADAFVDPPRGASLPEAPFLDAGLAALAASVGKVGQGEFTQLDEEQLERGLRYFGPLFGALGALAVAVLAMALVRGEWSGFSALLAATAYALWPAAMDVGLAGSVDLAVMQAALAAFGAAILAQTATSRDAFDWVQGGMSGGMFAAAALLLGPTALLFVPGLALGYWLVMKREQGEQRHAARRAGLLFALTATAVTILAAGGLAGEGIGARWARGVSELSFACGAPFLLAGALVPGRRGSLTRIARGVGALAAVVLVPYAATNLWPRLEPAIDRWWAAPLETPGMGLALGTGLALVAAWRCRRSEEGAVRALAWAALVLLPLGLVLPAAAAPAAVFGCVAMALALLELPERQRVPMAGSLVLALAGLLLLRPGPTSDRTDADALRCLRAVSPAVAWDSSRGRIEGSVLAPWTLGHRIAYLGRRAPTASGFGHQRVSAARALESMDEAGLARAMDELGARHVLAGELIARSWPQGKISYGRTLIASLVRNPPGEDSSFEEVLRLGDPDQPLLVVLALRVPEVVPREQPSLQSR